MSEIQIVRRVDLNLSKSKTSLSFLVTCRSEKLIPRFLQFKLPKNVSDFSDKKQSLLLDNLKKHIIEKEKEVEKNQKRFDTIISQFNPHFVFLLPSVLNYFNQKELAIQKDRLNNKLENLKSFEKAKSFASSDTVVNISDKNLSQEEIDALSLGFSMSWPKKINSFEVKTNTEVAFKNILQYEKELDQENTDRVKTKMKSFAYNMIHQKEPIAK